MRTRLPLVLLAAAAGLTAGCSGSASDDPPPDPKPAYVEAARAVCSRADREFAALAVPTAAADFAPYVRSTVDLAAEAQTDLAALTPPPEDRAELEQAVLEPFAQLVADGQVWSQRVTAAGTDQARLLALLAERPTAADIDSRFLREYGLDACADALDQLG